MGEHGPFDHIANGINVRLCCAQVTIDFDAATIIQRHARFVKGQSFGVRLPSHGHQAVIGFPRDFFSFLVVGLHNRLVSGVDHFFDAMRQMELDPNFLHGALQLFAHGPVHGGNDGVLILHHMDFGAQARIHRAQFQTNHATTNDDHAFGESGKFQGLRGGDDALSIELDEGQTCRF